MNFKNISVAVFCLGTSITLLHGVTKTDQEVFGKWIAWQKVFKDCRLTQMQSALNKEYWDRTKSLCQKHASALQPLQPFIKDVVGASINDHGSFPLLPPSGKRTLTTMYGWFERDVPKVYEFMKRHNFLDAKVDEDERNAHIDDVISKNCKLLKVMFNHENSHIRHQYHFAVANRLFESCFSSWYSDKFFNMLNDSKFHQIGRFCYSIMWYYLVGDGWKHWHEDCLQALEQESKKGKEIVYIAGGNDIYQLLQRGIYKIRVIDPMLPSQPAYYAEGWDWLLKGEENNGIGDLLTVDVVHKKLVLKREKYVSNETFKASLSTGVDADLPKSITEWGIYDEAGKKRLGYVTFDRRFCDKKDFVTSPKQVLLASYNEMYYVALPDSLNGWGISSDGVPASMKMYVKQLRKPVTKQAMANMRRCEEHADFSFILLGSDPT